ESAEVVVTRCEPPGILDAVRELADERLLQLDAASVGLSRLGGPVQLLENVPDIAIRLSRLHAHFGIIALLFQKSLVKLERVLEKLPAHGLHLRHVSQLLAGHAREHQLDRLAGLAETCAGAIALPLGFGTLGPSVLLLQLGGLAGDAFLFMRVALA